MRIGRKETCGICGGTGRQEIEEGWFGWPGEEKACPYCGGKGSNLMVWFGLRCVALRHLVVNPTVRSHVGL